MAPFLPQPSPAFAWTQPSGAAGPVLVCEPLSPVARHLYTSRHLSLRDAPLEWEAAAGAVGLTRHGLRLVNQVHGADVAVVRRADGAAWTAPAADIILSNDPEVAIGVRIADCAPILLADTRRSAVAAVHAGWRGTMTGAAVACVEALRRELGSVPEDLVAAIGPCLGVCCGEMGHEVVEAFLQAGHPPDDVERWFSQGPGGRPHVNLVRANRDQLVRAGLQTHRIHSADLCTRSHADALHSYRAAGPGGGRMVALIRCR